MTSGTSARLAERDERDAVLTAPRNRDAASYRRLMLATKLAEFGWTGNAETSRFHALSAGNTPQPSMTGPPPVLGGNAGAAGGAVTGAAVAGERRAVAGGADATVVVVVLVEVLVLVLVLVDVVARCLCGARVDVVTRTVFGLAAAAVRAGGRDRNYPTARRARRRISSPSVGQIGRRGLRT